MAPSQSIGAPQAESMFLGDFLSVFITDVWPKRGGSFIRVGSTAGLAEYPYENASEQAAQLSLARASAAEAARRERTQLVDNSILTQVPMDPSLRSEAIADPLDGH